MNGLAVTLPEFPDWVGARPAKDGKPSRRIETFGPEEIAKPLPAVSYLVEGLRLAKGAPLLLAGPSFIGKTAIAQSLMLSLAAGKPVFGVYSCRPATVLHVDLEQGRDLTFRRYQRLARGMGVDLRSLGDRLRVAIKPSVRLDSEDGEEVYTRALQGVDFAVIDCLRAAAPSADENSSDVRQWIDLLDRIGERTGTVVALIHHMKKPSAGAPEGARNAIRGSSAIFDACGAVYAFTGEKGQPARVHHEKERTKGVLLDDFGLRIEDVEVDGVRDAGLRVVHLEPEQLDAADVGDPKLAQNIERLRAFFLQTPVHHGNRKALRSVVGMKADAFSAALSVLESKGEVVAEDGPVLRWIGGAA